MVYWTSRTGSLRILIIVRLIFWVTLSVAILHSFVGLAAVLVGIGSYVDPDTHFEGVEKTIHEVEIFLGVFIGAITFTGSVIAFGKLQGTISGKPLASASLAQVHRDPRLLKQPMPI